MWCARHPLLVQCSSRYRIKANLICTLSPRFVFVFDYALSPSLAVSLLMFSHINTESHVRISACVHLYLLITIPAFVYCPLLQNQRFNMAPFHSLFLTGIVGEKHGLHLISTGFHYLSSMFWVTWAFSLNLPQISFLLSFPHRKQFWQMSLSVVSLLEISDSLVILDKEFEERNSQNHPDVFWTILRVRATFSRSWNIYYLKKIVFISHV